MFAHVVARPARRLLAAVLALGLAGAAATEAAAAPPSMPVPARGTEPAGQAGPSPEAGPLTNGFDAVVPGGGMSGYRIVDIGGGAPGISQLDPYGISDDGRVVGQSVEYGLPRGFTWTAAAGYQYLEDPSATITYVRAIAGDGTVAARTFDAETGTGRYVEWPGLVNGELGPMEVVAGPDADGYGEIIGVASDGTMGLSGASPALLSPGGGYTPLPTLNASPSGRGGAAYDMNDDGDLAGFSVYDDDGQPGWDVMEPTIWTPAATSAGWPNGQTSGEVTAINDVGEYVVQSPTGGADLYYRHDGTWEHLPLLPGAVQARALGMNDRGQIVGSITLPTGPVAVLWAGGEVFDLDQFLEAGTHWTLQRAVDINDDGQIVGDGAWYGNATGFFLDPVNPVVFVHGAGASRLSTVADDGNGEGDELWLDCGESRRQLSLWPEDLRDGVAESNVAAFDALQNETCFGANEWVDEALDTYGTLLDGLRASGYFVEYDKGDRLDTMTTGGCDLSQDEMHPNLFVFAYDWRKDNAESAAQLADFLGCVQLFWPGRDINLVAHSMGSLVSRRLILDHEELPIERLITIGAPWLGAPKLVNVLQTGDFAPAAVNGPLGIVQRIVQSFPAAHQLMAAAYYDQLALNGVFVEDGWDINGDGDAHQDYTYVELADLLNVQVPVFDPATTAAEFQSYSTPTGHQADWTSDDTEVDYTHIIGLQAGTNTIGRVVATTEIVCGWDLRCEEEQVIRQRLVCGDGTVPLVSAARIGNGLDYNAADADLRLYVATDPGQNGSTEHTGLTANPFVRADILHLLLTDPSDDEAPSDRSGLGSAGQDVLACMPPAADPQQGLVAGAASATASMPVVDGALRFVSVLGAVDVTMTDGAPRPRGEWMTAPGVTTYPSDRPDATMFTTPLSLTTTYTMAFTTTDGPLAIEVLDGTQDAPTAAVRWLDADLPDGVTAWLTLGADGTEKLRYDSDGDGAVDTLVTPTVSVHGADATDVTAPTVDVVASGSGAATRYAVTASDAESGVARILWSTDGTHFQPYTSPFTLSAGTTTLSTFAEDRAGNRSALAVVDLASVRRTPLTVATVDPVPAASGWSSTPVTVHLAATDATGGTAIDHLVWSATGATTTGPTTVAGASGSFPITAEGVTTISFWSVASDGTVEATRTVQVRIDLTDPTAGVRAPYPGSVTPDLSAIAGTASDAASGVASVELELRNSAGRWWDGAAWATTRTWLPTAGTSVWARAAGMPSGDALPTGAYRIGIRVTDASGRTSTAAPVDVTVSSDGSLRIVALLGPVEELNQTSARGINDRGAAVGVSSGGTAMAMRWHGGTVDLLEPPAGEGAYAAAIADDGTTVGRTGDGRAAVWAPDGTLTLLADLPGRTGSEARAVNDLGVVVGQSGSVPAQWADGVAIALPAIGAGATGYASDINGAGVIVGRTTSPIGTVATLWDETGPVNLGTLGGAVSAATAINEFGDVVGSAQDRFGHTWAFFHDGDTMVRVDEGLFSDGSVALDVNDRGDVVGEFVDRSTRTTRAFLYRPGLGAVDLNTLLPTGSGWVLQSARGINELGQIVGFGMLNGSPRGFVMSTIHAPVVEDAAATAPRGTSVDVVVDAWDPNTIDTVTLAIVDAPAHGSAAVVGGTTIRYTPAAGFHGTDVFTYRADDGNLDSNLGTVTVTVLDGEVPPVGPVAAIAAPTSAVEGTSIALDATGSADLDGTITSYAWDLDADGAFDDASTPTATMPAVDDGVALASVRVTDDDGMTDVATAAVTVTNSAPSVQLSTSAVTVRVGDTVHVTGTFADAGVADTHTASVDTGTGDAPSALPLHGAAFVVDRVYATAGTFTLRVAVCDDEGECTSATVTVTVDAVEQLPPEPGPAPTPGATEYVPVVPERFLDTRPESAVGYSGPMPGAGAVVEVQVTGVGATDVPADALAVVLNVAGDAASGDGFVTVWPCGSPRPLAANLNLIAGGTRPNLVIAKVGVGGKVCMFTQSGTHLVADVNGWFPATSSYVPVVPERFLDTRPESAVGYSGPKPGAGAVVEVQVTGVGATDVPTDAMAVVLNVAGDAATADGFVTVWPCGQPRPLAANLNLSAGVTAPNLVIAKVGDGGKVCMFTQSGTHLVADVNGWFPAGSSPTAYVPVVPERFLDTRPESAVGYSGPMPGAGAVVEVQVTGVGATDVPADALAVVLNVAGDAASGDGFVTVWPCGSPRPLAANLNLIAGGTRPNLVIAKVGVGGKVCMFTQSGTHLVADVNGWFPAIT